jgi:hypothetical protein
MAGFSAGWHLSPSVGDRTESDESAPWGTRVGATRGQRDRGNCLRPRLPVDEPGSVGGSAEKRGHAGAATFAIRTSHAERLSVPDQSSALVLMPVAVATADFPSLR